MKKFIKTTTSDPVRRVGSWFLASSCDEARRLVEPHGFQYLGLPTESEKQRWKSLQENDDDKQPSYIRTVDLPNCCGNCAYHWPLVTQAGYCGKRDSDAAFNQICGFYKRRTN